MKGRLIWIYVVKKWKTQFIKISGVNFDDNLNFRDRMYGSSSIAIGGILRRLKVGGSYELE